MEQQKIRVVGFSFWAPSDRAGVNIVRHLLMEGGCGHEITCQFTPSATILNLIVTIVFNEEHPNPPTKYYKSFLASHFAAPLSKIPIAKKLNPMCTQSTSKQSTGLYKR